MQPVILNKSSSLSPPVLATLPMIKAGIVLPSASAELLLSEGRYWNENAFDTAQVQDYVSGLAPDYFLSRESFKDGLIQHVYQTAALGTWHAPSLERALDQHTMEG